MLLRIFFAVPAHSGYNRLFGRPVKGIGPDVEILAAIGNRHVHNGLGHAEKVLGRNGAIVGCVFDILPRCNHHSRAFVLCVEKWAVPANTEPCGSEDRIS